MLTGGPLMTLSEMGGDSTGGATWPAAEEPSSMRTLRFTSMWDTLPALPASTACNPRESSGEHGAQYDVSTMCLLGSERLLGPSSPCVVHPDHACPLPLGLGSTQEMMTVDLLPPSHSRRADCPSVFGLRDTVMKAPAYRQ